MASPQVLSQKKIRDTYHAKAQAEAQLSTHKIIKLLESLNIPKNVIDEITRHEHISPEHYSYGANRIITLFKNAQEVYNAEGRELIEKLFNHREEIAKIINNQKALKAYDDYKEMDRYLDRAKFLRSKENKQIQEIINKAQEPLTFTDKAGKTHTISPQAQEQWLKTFNLKSVDEDFIPNFSQEVKEALSEVLKGKELKINRKDLEKLVLKGREKYIPQIKEVLDNPQVVFKDEKGDLIFARNIDKKLYFTNISREYADEFLSVSLSPKKESILLNKLQNAKQVVYNALDFKLRDSSAHKAFTGVLSSTNKSNTTILPQKESNGKTLYKLENPLSDNVLLKDLSAQEQAQVLKVQDKFKFNEKKAKDLLEWHKDSSAITKDKDGLPKVFYHGSKAEKEFNVFSKDDTGSGYFSAQ